MLYAAEIGHQFIVHILLQHGADMNVKNTKSFGKLIIFIHTYLIYTFKFIIQDINSVENKTKNIEKTAVQSKIRKGVKKEKVYIESIKLIWLSNIEKIQKNKF